MTRFLDILISATALLLFLPFGLTISLLLRFTGEGEVFYRQQRIGRDGRPFGLLKFATMLKNSPALGTGDVTIKDDPRVLPVGRMLRKTKLNEIPQLLNVLVGDMSIVGPRPQTPRNFEYFPEVDRPIIASMRPGLTGVGSIVFRDEESIVAASNKAVDAIYRDDIGPYKAELEKWYRDRQGLGTYLLVIFVTAWVILRPSSQLYHSVWPSLPEAPGALRDLL